MSKKQEILKTIREYLGKEIPFICKGAVDFIDGFLTEADIKGNLITFNLAGDQQLHVDLAKKSFTIITFKFDYYRDPCPGYVFDSEEDITEKCLEIIGDLADIMEVFSE